jgi:hypothetical protein
METIVIIIAVLLAIAAFILAIGRRLPNRWQIERAVLVNGAISEVFGLLGDLRQWQNWTVWTPEIEPDLSFEYPTGKSRGIGATQTWLSPRLRGELKLIDWQENESLTYTFTMTGSSFVLKGTLALGFADNFFTQIAWRCELMPIRTFNPVQRYLGKQLRRSFDADIEESLQNLYNIFEGRHPVEDADYSPTTE